MGKNMKPAEICEVGVMLILLNEVLKCYKRAVFLKHGNFIEVFSLECKHNVDVLYI
jgi:hypothetical protein